MTEDHQRHDRGYSMGTPICLLIARVRSTATPDNSFWSWRTHGLTSCPPAFNGCCPHAVEPISAPTTTTNTPSCFIFPPIGFLVTRIGPSSRHGSVPLDDFKNGIFAQPQFAGDQAIDTAVSGQREDFRGEAVGFSAAAPADARGACPAPLRRRCPSGCAPRSTPVQTRRSRR
jgi:hypothetical protein